MCFYIAFWTKGLHKYCLCLTGPMSRKTVIFSAWKQGDCGIPTAA